jgi:Domain of unknown function (DUF6458)
MADNESAETEGAHMGIGAGIFLLVIGGIAAFGIKDSWSAIDLTAIGYICMIVGVIAIVIALVLARQHARTAHTETVEHHETGSTPPPVA